MNTDDVSICAEYAKLLCHKRQLDKAVTMLLEMAHDDLHEYLDSIKKIMEIDTEVTEPLAVLLRASVITEGDQI
jgi:hypothetical protein